MRTRNVIAALTLLILCVVAPGCSGPLTSLNETLALWHSDQRDDAVARSADEYARFRDANDLEEAAVRGWADALATRLDEVPIVAKREPLGPAPSERLGERRGTLDSELRTDLLSHQASRVARAIGSIAGLGLGQHATALIALIYAPKVVEPDGGVLEALDGAERTVTIKRLAVDALEKLK
ncbi:MAG: hypothetical protein ACPGU1_14645 [Myxococcota bacterium]